MDNDIEIIIDNREIKIKEILNNILNNNYNIITAKLILIIN